MSAKQGKHKWSLTIKINYGCKCIVHMYITAEFKAYWLTCFFLLLSAEMLALYVGYGSSAVGHICTMWQAHVFRGICQ